eukprot:2569852-Amphidinium_carterae.1
MRGVIQWIDSWLLGRPCRGMLAALVARQYYERTEAHELTHTLRQALLYLKAALLAAQGRVISISSAAPRPVLVYTDAAAEGLDVKLGALLIPPVGKPICSWTTVPLEVIQQWTERQQYI